MSTTGSIHWEEGLFLRPHHLQMMQRQAFEQRAAERQFFQTYPYGVIEAKISRDELSNMMIRFDRLRAIMPSGVVVDAPNSADLPPLDIEKVFQASSGPLQIYLAVPLWYATRANTIDGETGADWRTKRLYQVSEIEVPDENTGENPQSLRVRRINARLLREGDDQTDFEIIPLLRIAHGVGEEVGIPREDPTFAPPCLGLRGSNVLLNKLRDLHNAVDATRRELTVQMTRGGFSVEMMRGIQFEQMLRLQTVNRYAARLPSLVEAQGVSLFTLYLEVRGLLSELAALRPDRDLFGVPDYDHDEPLPCFSELLTKIRPLLEGTVAPSFLRLDFTREGNLFVSALRDEHLSRPTDYYLAIKTNEDPIALARLVEDGDQFKLMPKSLAGRAIRGIKLTEERQTPLQLPADASLHYFRLVRADNPRMWERVTQERTLTAQWPNSEVADVQLTLYMPVPEAGAE